MIPLAVFEAVIDASGAAPRIEAMLPIGVRPRQLKVRTLLAGMCLAQADHRPAHLTRVHQALTSLPAGEQRRLGVITEWKHGPHRLTYRQAERTFGLAGIHPGAVQEHQPVAGGGLDGPGVLLPAPARQGRALRRHRGILGTPQEQPAAPRR
jgi:hypothetical protein